MKFLLPLLLLVNCDWIKGVLEWTVMGKVTDYGQNATLFCNVPNCCPQESGWDRWTPVQRTLFIDVKTGHPNKKYDGKVFRNGYTLIIQNLSKTDVNVSYSCLYGVTLGERKLLLAEDVFAYPKTSTPNGDSRFSEIEIAALFVGVLVSVTVVIAIVWFRIKRSNNVSNAGTPDDMLPLLEKEHLLNRLIEIENVLNDVIPSNIRDDIKRKIKDWEKKDSMFVSTRASEYVIKSIQKKSCLTLTAPVGVGKTIIARHTALVLQKEGYNIIPIDLPLDIKTYYQHGKQTVFLIDDICGNFTANQQQIDSWKQMLPVIDTIIADKCCKIIVSCRLQVYKDEKFNVLLPFKAFECNIISNKLGLTSDEKKAIAKTYIGNCVEEIDELSYKYDFFPLLCFLCQQNEDVEVTEFFKNPFDIYKSELDRLSEHGYEGNYKICSLALCVLFNNQLNEKWFLGKVTDEQRPLIEDICIACDINIHTSKYRLMNSLETLDGTFIYKQYGIYSTMHTELFDFLVHYFGQKMIGCLIEHADSAIVNTRFIWQRSKAEDSRDFMISIPDDYLESYLERFIKDWFAGKVRVVFNNINMKVSSFREQLLRYILQLDKQQQVTLANTKDTAIPKENHESGTTPLKLACYDDYSDMVHWILQNDVNQCRIDGVTGLARQNGNPEIGT